MATVATTLTMIVSGCASSARTHQTAAAAPALADTESGPSYVTLPIDEPASEWRFVDWLKAGGEHVERDGNGEDRVFNSPGCRAILVKYRRMLRLRMDVSAQNVLNINTTSDAQGANHPYRRRFVEVHPDGTFEVKDDPSAFPTRYLPGHPGADAKGQVRYPNVDLAIEQVNTMESAREYRLVTQILARFDPSYVADDWQPSSDIAGAAQAAGDGAAK